MKDTPPGRYIESNMSPLSEFFKKIKKRVIGVVCLCYDSVTNVKIEH